MKPFLILQFLSLLLIVVLIPGCVLESDPTERVDYGDGFYFQWYTFIGDAGIDQKVWDIGHDSEGNIYILATSGAPLGDRYGDPLIPWSVDNQSLLMKMNSDGITVWHMFLPGNKQNYYKMEIDQTDQIFLLGISSKSFILKNMDPVSAYNGGNDSVLIKLDSEGGLIWYSFFGGPGDDSTTHLQIDQNGTLYFNGRSSSKWDQKYGPPVDEPVFDYEGRTLYMASVNFHGQLISHTFSAYQGHYLSPGLFCFASERIYMSASSSLDRYVTHLEWALTRDLETVANERSNRSQSLISNFWDGNIFGYEYGDRSENSVMEVCTYDGDLNLLWNFTMKNYNDEEQSYAGFAVYDTAFDINNNIFFLAHNAGKILTEYYDYPVISPLLKYLSPRTDTIYTRKFLMKISGEGTPEWYSYLGHSGEYSYYVNRITAANTGEIYIAENNSHFLWPDIYGSPIEKYSGTPEPYDGTLKYSILIAKLQSNPPYPKIRIYETVYKKLIPLKKKTYIKLEYSVSLPFGISNEGHTYILYKFDNEGKRWEEINRHTSPGDYSYKDKHAYQEEFNHYKVTAFNSNGERIAESRIVSIYPPRPDLNIEVDGD